MPILKSLHLVAISVAAATVLSIALPAQSSPAGAHKPVAPASGDDESQQVAPRFASGVSAGAMSFPSGLTEQAVSLTMLFRVVPWLELSTAPGYARASSGTTAKSGLTDIPFSAVALHGFADAPWSPSISGALSTTISPGDSTAVLGAGHNAAEAAAAFSVSPTDRLDLSADVSRPMTAHSGNGSLSLESAMSFGRATASVGVNAELGRPDSAAALSRSFAGGIAYSLAGPLTLTVDGSHVLSGGGPAWTMSVGIGTAFAGLSPLGPTSSLKRIKHALGARATSSSGYAKAGGSSGSCKKAGTC
jgi:hypothetical protein